MAVGSLIHGRMAAVQTRLVQYGEHGVHLRLRAKRLEATAAKVAASPDPDAAMQVLIEHRDLLVEERELLDSEDGKELSVAARVTLDAGNRRDLGTIEDAELAKLPLLFHGLEADDASGRVLRGTSEQIAISLYQAHRAGFPIEVMSRDTAARAWRIKYNGEELTIEMMGDSCAYFTHRDRRNRRMVITETADGDRARDGDGDWLDLLLGCLPGISPGGSL
jgi:hypothetical protein